MNRTWERRGVVWPVLLILAGALLLLNNAGRLDYSIWELLVRLWPAILLAIGIELLVPTHTAAGYFLTVLLVLAVFVGSFWLLDNVQPRAESTTAIDEPIPSSGSASLVINPIIGELRLQAGSPAQSLVAGDIPESGGNRITIDRSRQAGQEVLKLSRDIGASNWVVFPFRQDAWDLALSPEVPLDLEADMAVGLMDLDLTGLDLQTVSASLGLGEIRLRLPDQAANVKVDGGMGSVRIMLPTGASVRIEISRGLSTLDLPSGYRYVDGIATSPAAQSGGADLRISVDLGVGAISISER